MTRPLCLCVSETPLNGLSAVVEQAASMAGLKRGDYETVAVVPTPVGKTPSKEEAKAGAALLYALILERRPKLVLVFGKAAVAPFLVSDDETEDDDDSRSFSDVRGRPFEWRHPSDSSCVVEVIATWHPYVVSRQGWDSDEAADFVGDVSLLRYAGYVETRRLPADTGKRVRSREFYGEKVYNAWFYGDDVRFLVGDESGARREVSVRRPWYFLAPLSDFVETNRAEVERILTGGVTTRHRTLRVVNMEQDPQIPSWVRIYPEAVAAWTTEPVKVSAPPGSRMITVSPFVALARAFEAAGVRTFEADVNPLRRFLTDHEIRWADDHRVLHVDIETDDKTLAHLPISEVVGKVPVLSIGAEDDFGGRYYRALTRYDAAAERDLLRWFFEEVAPRYDFMTAWNGSAFDWPFLRARCHFHGFDYPFHRWVLWDSMFSFKKHHAWDADTKTSFKLDNVSRVLLSEGKVERPAGRIFDLWASDPSAHERYNMGDVDRERRIEAKTGYVDADRRMNTFANCPPWNPHISARVDGMALVEGYCRGTHFRTKEIPRDEDLGDKFHGAYVYDPTPGVYTDVANLDFKSLYPSVFCTWNVSPDTYVPPDEVAAYDKSELTFCPSFVDEKGRALGGSIFRKGPLGVLPSIYARVAAERERWKKERKLHPVGSEGDQHAKRHEYVAKSLGLSIYGCMGSVYSRYFNRAVAEAVTLTAQFLIRSTMKLAEAEGHRALYGDTDSLFLAVPETYVPAFLSRCAAFYAWLTTALNAARNDVELEYEQYFSRLVLMRKKRYAGRLVVQKNKACDVLEVKGLEMRRSDGARLARGVQEEIVTGVVMRGWDVGRVRDVLVRLRDRVFGGGLTIDELKITAAIQKPLDAYKTAGPHVVVARRMRDRGLEVFPGTKIAYVVVDGRRGVVAVDADEYAADPVGYDPVFYWRNKIWPSLERFVSVVYANEDWSSFADMRYAKENRRLVAWLVGAKNAVS